jgi:3-oxoacyl-[acyl-carrier protein] reductase
MCQAAIPAMREQRWGRVVAITSIGVKSPIGGLMASSVARAAVTSFLKITAREVAADGVTVNNVLPGYHRTNRMVDLYDGAALDELTATVPTHTLGDPDDFGAVVAFLCSEQARFVTGTSLLVDGGSYPGLL